MVWLTDVTWGRVHHNVVTYRMSHVFKAAHSSPSRRSIPSSASSIPTVCGRSVCLCTGWHRHTQSDRRQDK